MEVSREQSSRWRSSGSHGGSRPACSQRCLRWFPNLSHRFPVAPPPRARPEPERACAERTPGPRGPRAGGLALTSASVRGAARSASSELLAAVASPGRRRAGRIAAAAQGSAQGHSGPRGASAPSADRSGSAMGRGRAPARRPEAQGARSGRRGYSPSLRSAVKAGGAPPPPPAVIRSQAGRARSPRRAPRPAPPGATCGLPGPSP